MRIEFALPPKSKSTGGLDTAILGVDLQSTRHKTDEPQLVHFHGLWNKAHSSYSAQLRKKNISYCVSPHGMLEPWAMQHKAWKKRPWFQFIEKKHLQGASTLFATGEPEKESIEKWVTTQAPCEIIPFGIDAPAYCSQQSAREKLKISSDERVLLFLSRIDQKKGVDLLLNALGEFVSQETPSQKIRLLIVGDGDDHLQQNLKALSEAISKNESLTIDWLGGLWGSSQSQKWLYYAAADLFCLPTHSENFGFVVLEALASGCPVLTTDQTPWKTIADERAALICQPNTASVLNSLHKHFQSTPLPEKNRAELANKYQETYRWESVARSYLQVYKRIVKGTL